METNQNQNKQENQNKVQNFLPISVPGPNDISQNPILYLTNPNPNFDQDEQTKKNGIFIQKRNRMEDQNKEKINELEFNSDINKENKKGDKNDANIDVKIDVNMKSQNHKTNQFNGHEQFICKKMSLDLEDEINSNNNQNSTNKKMLGCNCKNSGCLKRYCECFSRMKYCDNNCQCKNCLNNIKYEKERNEAIRIYLIKSPVSFKKINMDLNNVICNCKKSNCLKNYCECFQLGLKCTYNCGCVDCKNRNLFEKKLFFVENNCDSKKNNNKNSNITIDRQKLNINNQNNSMIRLQEEEINNNNSNNNKINNNNNINKENNNKKNINNPQFIVNKNVNDLIYDNNSILNLKNRTRFLSFDDDMSQISQWNNINLKKIEISNKKVIIDNYNIKQPEYIGNSYQGNIFNNYTNNIFNNINNNNNNNRIITRKNSAFSAIIK